MPVVTTNSTYPDLAREVIAGRSVTRAEAVRMLETASAEEIADLIAGAALLRRHAFGIREGQLPREPLLGQVSGRRRLLLAAPRIGGGRAQLFVDRHRRDRASRSILASSSVARALRKRAIASGCRFSATAERNNGDRQRDERHHERSDGKHGVRIQYRRPFCDVRGAGWRIRTLAEYGARGASPPR